LKPGSIDRLLHHAVGVQIEGSSYRLRRHADLMPEHIRSKALSTRQSRQSRRAAAVGHPKMERPITILSDDHRKPVQLGNFTSAHLGKFESALTVGEICINKFNHS
jgi:hypothetical protein